MLKMRVSYENASSQREQKLD